MAKRIVFKNTQHSKVLEDHANQQLARIEEFLAHERDPIYIDLFIEPSHVHAHHRVELRIKTPNYERNSHFEGPDFYAVLDRVLDTMYKELHEDKAKRKDNLKMVGRHEEFKKQR